jgi:hypothetical protein
MKVALYIGNHRADGLLSRTGWALTRRGQKGEFDRTTHVEAIHTEYTDGSVKIASASVRDKGVRGKDVRLNPLHWRIADVRPWDVERSIDLLIRTDGEPYDFRGAFATIMPGSPRSPHGFCTSWTGYPFLQAAATFAPNHFAAICFSLGADITDEFFRSRA